MHPTRWAETFTVSTITAICDDKPVISIFRIFLRKVIESSFWCKFTSFASCARAYETWKTVSKNCIKSSWMHVNKIFLTRDHPEQFPSFFVCSFQSNQTTLRWSLVPKAYHFLKILANCVASMLFHCFYYS